MSKALYDLDEEGEEDAGIMASDFFGSGPKSATKIGSKSVAKNGSNKALGGVQRKPVGSDEEDDYYGSGSDGDEMEPGDGDDDGMYHSRRCPWYSPSLNFSFYMLPLQTGTTMGRTTMRTAMQLRRPLRRCRNIRGVKHR